MSSKAVPPFPAELKPPRRPLLWAAFAYGAGIVLGAHAWRPVVWWVVAVVFMGASA